MLSSSTKLVNNYSELCYTIFDLLDLKLFCVLRHFTHCSRIFFLSQASIDRGYGRCLVYTKAQTNLKKYPNQTFDRVDGPSRDPTTGEVIEKHKVTEINRYCITV